jgi:hypothetical protein
MCTQAAAIYSPVTPEFALEISVLVYTEHDQVRKDSRDLPSVVMGWSVFNYEQGCWVLFLFILPSEALEPTDRPVSC